MGAISPVAAFKALNCTTMSGTDYKNQNDSNSVAGQRIVTRFAPHASSSPNMTVLVDPGSIFDGITLTEMPQQATPTFTPPVNYKRIDRIVLDNVTGSIVVVAGQEATNAVPPAIPNGKSPIAQVAIAVGATAITNNMISDERNFAALATGGFGAQAPVDSGATCDLGAVLSRNALVTGMTSITSFGSSANTQSPIYLIEFTATLLLKNGAALALPGGADIATAGGDTAMAEYLGNGNWRVRTYTRANGRPVFSGAPTRQYLTSSSGTYNTPLGCTALLVRYVGGGGGGGSGQSGKTDGTAGTSTVFNGIEAAPGQPGLHGPGAGGAGGTGGAGAASLRIAGQAGNASVPIGANRPTPGATGGSSPMFGGGGPGGWGLNPGQNGSTNTGGGGGGGGGTTGTNGSGGGSGEYVEIYIANPASSYAYSIGYGGPGGSDTTPGGSGGSGLIIVEEYYT